MNTIPVGLLKTQTMEGKANQTAKVCAAAFALGELAFGLDVS